MLGWHTHSWQKVWRHECVTSVDSFPDLPVGQSTQSRQNVCWHVSGNGSTAICSTADHYPFSPIIGWLDLAVSKLVVFLGTLSELPSLKYWLLSSSGRSILWKSFCRNCNNCSNQSWISGPTAYCYSCGWSWNSRIYNLYTYTILHGHEWGTYKLYNRSPYISI